MESGSPTAPADNVRTAGAPAEIPGASASAPNSKKNGPIWATIHAVENDEILHESVFLHCCNASQRNFPAGEAPNALYLAEVARHLLKSKYVMTQGPFFTINEKKAGQDLEDYLEQMMTQQFKALMEEDHCDAVLGLCGGQEVLEAMQFEEAGVHFAFGEVVKSSPSRAWSSTSRAAAPSATR